MRKSKTSLLFVVANFEDAEVEVDVFVPAHAFEFLELRERDYNGTELLTGRTENICLKANHTVHIKVPARGAVIYKIPQR